MKLLEKLKLRKSKESSGNSVTGGNAFSHSGFSSLFFTTDKFAKDIFTKQNLSIHEEKRRAKRWYYEHALVHKGCNSLKNLIFGGEIRAVSSDDSFSRYVEKLVINSKGLGNSLDVAIQEAVNTGDGYIEILRGEKSFKFAPIYNSEDMYIDYDYEEDKVKRYILRVDNQQQKLYSNVQSFTILTPRGSETITGIELNKEDIIHLPLNQNRYGVYGFSPTVSNHDLLRILDTIERSIAVISRYRAVPKKALFQKRLDNTEPKWNEKEQKSVSDKLAQQQDFEMPVFNSELGEIDLSFGGKDIDLSSYIDYLKRSITIAYAPEYIIHGENVNRSTSDSQEKEFHLELQSIRKPWEEIITKKVLELIFEYSEFLSLKNIKIDTNLELKFGEYNFELPQEKRERILSLWESGLITLSEARKELELEFVEGVDLFRWELESGPALPSVQNEKLNSQNNAKKNK